MNCKIFSKKIIIIGIIAFAIPLTTFANECKYTAKIQECTTALESFLGGTKNPISSGSSIKSVTDFPCLQHNSEMRAYQIIMDENFKEVDEQMQTFLENLYTSKNYYFGENSDFTISDAVNHIEALGDGFQKNFDEACTKTVAETLACSGGSLTVDQTKDFIDGAENGSCRLLAQKKVSIFKKIARNGLALNSAALERDAKRKYNKQQRTKYDEVLDLMMFHLSYIERMWKKTSSFSSTVYDG